jgi:hypothetical protein
MAYLFSSPAPRLSHLGRSNDDGRIHTLYPDILLPLEPRRRQSDGQARVSEAYNAPELSFRPHGFEPLRGIAIYL